MYMVMYIHVKIHNKILTDIDLQYFYDKNVHIYFIFKEIDDEIENK